ncbi:MAG TPA: radical SAM protein [Elusimicrobiota bacterium]|nr:radical SAM protein [Elusimicrobiota bacterium]
MKVLLIQPPMRNLFSILTPKFVPENWGYYPPLGILYLAAYLQKNSSHEVEILDTQVEKLSDEQIKAEVARRKPDMVGIQALTFTLRDCLNTARLVKEVSKDIPVVLGGRHVDCYPDETLGQPWVDAVLLGEADISFTKFVNAWGRPDELRKVPGIRFRDKGEMVSTGQPEIITDINQLPFPARTLTPIDKYRTVVQKSERMTTIVTSRGCPFHCGFCDENLVKFRQASAERVLEEMGECLKLGIREFFFFDDTFTVNEKRLRAVCDGILERKWDVLWDVRAHINSVNEPLLEKMREAGCDRIQFGVESGDARIIKIIGKDILLDRTKNVFSMARKLGFTTYADFMIGLPGETRREMQSTFDFAVDLQADYCQFSVYVPFPGTRLFGLGLEKRLYPSDYWREFAKDPIRDFSPPIWNEFFSKDELIAFRDQAYRQFYFRPSYVLQNLRKSHSMKNIFEKARIGIDMALYYVKELLFGWKKLFRDPSDPS